MEVVSGAILGVAFQQLHDSIVRAKVTASAFKFQLQFLENKAQILIRKFNEIKDLNLENKLPAEMKKLRELLEKAKVLVSKCSQVSWWNYGKKRKFAKRLEELDASFQELLKVDFQVAQLKNILETLLKVIEMNKKLDIMDKKLDLGSNPSGLSTRENSESPGTASARNKGDSSRVKVLFEKRSEKVIHIRFN
ncbi:hypothetical protein P3X46_018832 [Hevea brasiliensis]|uniref:RPW8 domain-containing protein n=1 Tax=Hevea brasiliensis TaxID=3981 RepID=A0ABQ9LRW9_HEVBR|nr:uncharacterized protein LOC131183823 [Hevea brasiliensis]KAJ9170749.1 hypothetical protein P3X46_018832 [Hevea brasiliensis]